MGRLGIFLALVLLVVVISNVDGRRGGGGGRGGRSGGGRGSSASSSSSRSRSSSSGSSSRSRGSSYGGKPKKKKGIKSKLKKAAIVGVGVWAAYKVTKATAKFAAWGIGGLRPNWGFNDWNRWREREGMLCRNDQDCRWLDPNFQCSDYELTFTPSNFWFGGDFAQIRGQCECSDGWDWADRDFGCERTTFLPWVLALIVVAVLSSLCCCCIGVACWCRK